MFAPLALSPAAFVVPGAHGTQSFATTCSSSSQNSIGVQTRSLLAVGAAVSRCVAGLHVDTGVQLVDPGAAAKETPATHATHAVAPVPDAEAVPTGHAPQTTEPLESEQLVCASHLATHRSHFTHELTLDAGAVVRAGPTRALQ